MKFPPLLSLIAAILLLSSFAYAQEWGTVAVISDTIGVTADRLCLGESSRGDIGCPAYAPFVNPSGFVGIGTADPSASLTIYKAINDNNMFRVTNGTNYVGINANNIFAGNSLGILSGSANNLNILSGGATGRVGIGLSAQSSTPSTTLHVSGTLRIADSGEVCDANRLGAIKYQSGNFYVCKSAVLGWEPLSTSTSSTTPSIDSGLSGSIVYRDEYGYLKANNTFSISSTTGSVGIGAGAPASVGNSGLFVSGSIRTAGHYMITDNKKLSWGGGNTSIVGREGTSSDFLAFTTSGTEALRIVSTGMVGIGTSNPLARLTVVGGTSNIAWGNSSPTSYLSGDQGGSVELGASSNNGANSVANGTPYIDFHYGNGFAEDFNARLINSGNRKFQIVISGSAAFTISGSQTGVYDSNPSTTLHVGGTLRLADGGEACDTNRAGAIRYQSGSFDFCDGVNGWRGLAAVAAAGATPTDRIVSGSAAAIIDPTGNITMRGRLDIVTGTNVVAVGRQAGQFNTSSNFTGLGYNAGRNNTAHTLTALGYLAGENNSGISTTAVGSYAGQFNTGTTLTALGHTAAQSNTAPYVTALGASAGQFNTGQNLSAMGASAGYLNTGNYVTALGYSAGRNNTGSDLTSVGYNAATSNTAPYVAALGSYAGQYNTSQNLTAVGFQSGQYNTSSSVVAVGNYAGQYNTGQNLTALGVTAGQSNTAPYVVALGAYAGQYNTGLKLTAVGTSAGQYNTGTSATVVGNSSGQYNTGIVLAALGHLAAQSNTAPYVTALGAYAGNTNTFSNVTLLGYNAQADKANQVVLGNSSVVEVSTAGIYVGAGLKASGIVTATFFEGNGSRLTGISSIGDRIVSGSAAAIIDPSGTVSVPGKLAANTVKISATTGEVCGPGNYGTIKIENGRLWMCRE